MKKLNFLSALGLVALSGCGDPQESAQTLEPIPPDSLIELASLGNRETFGSIDRVAVTSNSVLVLDAMNTRLHQFGDDGAALGTFGQEGQGPGELGSPLAIAVSSDGLLHVLDPSNVRIALYRWSNEDGFEWAGTVPLDLGAQDMCLVGNRIFLVASLDGMTVHEISREGEVLQSFGPAVPEDPILKMIFAAGRLFCDEESGTIVHVPMTFPTVQAYGTDGTRLWRMDLPDYHQTDYHSVGGSGIRPGLDEEGMAHAVKSVSMLGPDTLLVQLRVAVRGGAEVPHESRIVSLSTGAALGSLDLPVIAWIAGARVYSPALTPYPELKVYERPH